LTIPIKYKITEEVCEDIKDLYLNQKYSIKKIADEYNIHWQTMRKLMKNEVSIDPSF